MSIDNEIISESDRTELLRQGIQVLSATSYESEVQVYVAGGDENRARSTVIAQVGREVDVQWCGALHRALVPRPCVGYMEREAGRLQVRYVLTVEDEHISDIDVTEHDRTVIVFATMCTPLHPEGRDEMECPYHLYLDRPLGDRTVIDGFNGAPVPYKNVYDELKVRYGLG
ncbi:MAG: hypothetical protein QOH68_3064 [Nocardioidaceae bacterium]|nr:hypothetical protein [Nocardioidaceae bacterium]